VRVYSLFGLSLATDFPFANRLGEGAAPRDLTFFCEPGAAGAEESALPCIYESARPTAEGEPAVFLFRDSRQELLRFTGDTDFLIGDDHIVARATGPESLIETHLLGPVLSYWLERKGIVTLHGSAVALEQGAVGFLSRRGGGKSGMAAACLLSGGALLSDDLLPIAAHQGSFLVQPGYPQMRMWPDESTHFLGGCDHLPRVHPERSKRRVPVGSGGFGTFHGTPLPLACLYLLERQEEGEAPIRISTAPPREALIELLRQSFLPLLTEAAGFQPARFDLLSRLVLSVPVKRLQYPSGFDHLPRVAEAVRRDLEGRGEPGA
jgi:hypothetical protein